LNEVDSKNACAIRVNDFDEEVRLRDEEARLELSDALLDDCFAFLNRHALLLGQ
jgi:hypothetical protein